MLEKIRIELKTDSLEKYKIYAFIIDMHGTYDMCESCSDRGIKFQNDFRELIYKVFDHLEILLPKRFKSQLPIVLRYSSDIKYHYNNSPDPTKRSLMVSLAQNYGIKRDIDPIEPNEQYQWDKDRDIHHYGANLLVHGKTNWHSFWKQARRDAMTDKPIHLETWTVFTTDNSMRFLSASEKRKPYREPDGSVNTSSPSPQT